MPFAIKAQFDAVMHGPFAPHALPEPHVRQQCNGAVLEYAGANRRFDRCSAATFEHDRINALSGQEVRQQ